MYPFQVKGYIILAVIIFHCKGQNANVCDVYPKDPYIEVGSDTKVFCQLSCIQGKAYWTQDKKGIDESLSNTIINNRTHSVLSLTNFTQQSAVLECHSADVQQVLGGTIIKTYTKPSNISCELHYENNDKEDVTPELFTCNWKHNNTSLNETKYTVFLSQVPRAKKRALCNSDGTTCTTKDAGTKISLYNPFNVTVRAKTDAWEADSEPHEFDPFKILKITPPKIDVSVESNNLKIKWKGSIAKSEGKINCQDKYTETVGNKTSEVFNSTVEPNTITMQSRQVDSCRKYKVSVRCALESAPWSDWSPEQTALTELNTSDVKLHLWRIVTEKDTTGIRKVHVLWKPIPATCEGTFDYKIEQFPYKQHTTGLSHTRTECSNSTCDVNKEEHRVELTVFQNRSLLANVSVYVPATEGSLPRVTEIQTSAAEGVVLVKWTAPVQPVRAYMIHWTHDGNQYDWIETKDTNASLFGLLDKKQYNITVTPLFDDKTGLGSQAVQICSGRGDPDNIHVTVRADHRSARVKWVTQSQEECSGVVINYTVFYGTQGGPSLNVTVNSGNQDVVLIDLNPNTKYEIYINATASTGTSKSNTISFTTNIFDPRRKTVLTVCGSIVIIIVLSFGLCVTIQWMKFREKPVPDPGLSSLAEWLLPDHQKGMCLFQAFSNPSESFCDSVITEEMQTTTPCSSASSYYPESDEAEEYNVGTSSLTSQLQNEKPDEHVETHPCSSAESAELLSPGNKPLSPYKRQNSLETPDLRTGKQSQHVPVKQPEKKAPMTVYISLNVLKEGPVIETETITNIQEYIRPE